MSAFRRVYWATRGLVLLAALFARFHASAASLEAIERYQVRNWQTDDGLPQNPVWAITQTADGYLWVGTQQGLVRFDGVRFLPLDESAPGEIRHGYITALCATGNGTLWIGTDSTGIWRLDARGFTSFGESEGLANNKVHCLLEGSDGAVWIGTENGLSHLKDGKFSNLTTKEGLAHNSVRALCADRAGNIRVATGRGLSTINAEGAITTMTFGSRTTPNSLKGTCVDQAGNVWVTSPEGVTRADESGQKFFSPSEGLPSPIATALAGDHRGGIWAGTYNGVICIRNGKVTARPLNEAGFGDLINTIFEDREENIWVGARDGLYRITPARFTAYTVQEGLACNNVMSVLEDRAGAMWFATWGGGLDEFRDGKFTAFGPTNGLTHDKVLALHEGHDGSLWAGMDNGMGLNRLLGSTTNSFPKVAGLFDTAIRVIHEDRRGDLWIGTHSGLHVYSQGKFSSYTTDGGLAGNLVLVILEDSGGSIWIGTDEGLSLWNGKSFTNYRMADGLSHNLVQALYEDSDGSLWIGTRNGLNRLQNGKFRSYDSRQGLFSDDVYEIIEDDSGYFWMSCRTGIFRVRKEDFNSLDRGTISGLACTSFGRSDGLPTVQCNGIAKPAGWKSRDGRLWFPTIRGIVAVEAQIKTNEKEPPVEIQEVIVDRRLVKSALPTTSGAAHLPAKKGFLTTQAGISPGRNGAGGALEIPPGRGELEIHYAALSLQAPEKDRFKHKLEPVDPDWIDGGTRREAFYANVGPGTYHFRVMGCNNDGVWNETGASMTLVFLPHYWQMVWFKLISVAVIAALLAAWYRLRMARLREIEALRVQIAADLHDDVGARLTKVAMVTELVDRETTDADRNKPQIRNIARTTGEVIRAMDEIVWTINPSNDTLDNLANYLFQHAQEYFQNTGVRCRIDFPSKLPAAALSTEQRHNLFMAVKEALNNVLKHAHATEVRVSLAVETGRLLITVSDDGGGFVAGEEQPGADGLKNMRKRLEQIGGRLKIESSTGQGTKVQMEARL
jgi:ligand-binding sensor domain-containing protein/signal transduction histidine kinase